MQKAAPPHSPQARAIAFWDQCGQFEARTSDLQSIWRYNSCCYLTLCRSGNHGSYGRIGAPTPLRRRIVFRVTRATLNAAPADPTDALFGRFCDASWREIEQEWQLGLCTAQVCMAKQVQLLRATPEAIDRQIAAVAIDPQFPRFVDVCRQWGLRVVVLSDGLDRVVGGVLRASGCDLPYFANRLEWCGGDRWKLAFPFARSDCAASLGNCKCSHRASSRHRGMEIAVGDGRSDFCIAERSHLVLAKGRLASHCRSKKVPHWPINNFSDATAFLIGWLGRNARKSALSASHHIGSSELEQMTVVDRSEIFRGGPVGFLLIHGLGGTPAELRFVAIGLSRAGYTVHCPQLAGHCGTFEELRATGWKDWYATVKEAHDELLKTCRKVIVGGLSMGAILALHLAAERPDSAFATALFAPTLKLDGWGVPWYSFLFNLVRTRRGADLVSFSEREPYGIKDPRIRALVTVAINSGDSSKVGQLTNPGRVMLEMRWLVNLVKGELGSIRQPALIVHPRYDDRASLRNAAYLQTALGGMVDTCVLDDSYHVITIDRQRDLVVQRTAAFADSLSRRVLEDSSAVRKRGQARELTA